MKCTQIPKLRISPKFSEKLHLDEDYSSYSPSEIGGLTKRTSEFTENEFFAKGMKSRNRYQTCSTARDELCSSREVDFKRMAEEMKIIETDVISPDSSFYKSQKPLEDQSIEGLIDELKQEYQLNDGDITEIKSDFENTVANNLHSNLGQSFLNESNMGNMSQRVDRQTLKTNLMLKLMGKKVSKMTSEQ